ncbi:hypothetical protein BTZ20_4462 [Rhodococcus sp. MTM3W5.2]|nr:hypothetical protein [Rhodococcus sp. MTM3W5.2]AQA25344.1 hypothetical protein BTZ20_4462 [Rhodococcus sp. MTM3W5.2]
MAGLAAAAANGRLGGRRPLFDATQTAGRGPQYSGTVRAGARRLEFVRG